MRQGEGLPVVVTIGLQQGSLTQAWCYDGAIVSSVGGLTNGPSSGSAFALIAGSTGNDQVHPTIFTATTIGNNVFCFCLIFMNCITAVGAQATVTLTEFVFSNYWRYINEIDLSATLYRNNRVELNKRLLAGCTRDAAAHLEDRITKGPQDTAVSILFCGLFRIYPALGNSTCV
jgi:hypothetical protein